MEELKEQMEFKFITEGLTDEVVTLSQKLNKYILKEQLDASTKFLIIDIKEALFEFGLLEETELDEYIRECMKINYPPFRRTEEVFNIVKKEILRSCYVDINNLVS